MLGDCENYARATAWGASFCAAERILSDLRRAQQYRVVGQLMHWRWGRRRPCVCLGRGVHLAPRPPGDNLMISSGCGDPLATIPRWPQAGISQEATRNGTNFFWNSYITASGGVYWMCWCASAISCDRADMFSVQTGVVSLIGPYIGIERTCRSGMACGISGVIGARAGRGMLSVSGVERLGMIIPLLGFSPPGVVQASSPPPPTHRSCASDMRDEAGRVLGCARTGFEHSRLDVDP